MNILTTEIGNFSVQATDGEHVHACSGALNVDPAVINGVAYYVSVHLWKIGSIFATREYGDIYLGRGGLKDPSRAARQKAWIVISDAVNAWLRLNPQVLVQAQAAYRAAQIFQRDKQITDLRAQITALEQEITDLCDQKYQEALP